MSSDTQQGACPPVVEYSRAEQARVAEEVAALADGAVIGEWMADYAVLREQARACRSKTCPVSLGGKPGAVQVEFNPS